MIFAADVPLFKAPTQVFDFDPTANTITPLTLPAALSSSLNGNPAFVTRMVMLPNGDLLLSDSSNQLWEYTPDGGPSNAWRPTISDLAFNGSGIYTLTGTQLNGLSEGASYGDDAEMSSNYPIVQLTDASNHVFYARTFNWTAQVATGNKPTTTQFALPAGLPAGAYSLRVIANGISSQPTQLTVSNTLVSLDGSGNLVVSDASTAGDNDTLTIQADTANSRFVISDPNKSSAPRSREPRRSMRIRSSSDSISSRVGKSSSTRWAATTRSTSTGPRTST